MKKFPRPFVILVTEPDYFRSVLPRLRKIGRVIEGTPDERSLSKHIGRADIAVIRVETRLTRKILEKAGRLKLLASATTGLNHIDTADLKRRGIRLVHLHGTHTDATAEHALALLFSAARRIAEVQPAMRRGKWDRARWIGTQLKGKKLGIVGYGRIGRTVAKLARGVGLSVQAYDPYLSRRAFGSTRRVSSVAALLRTSDAVSIHASLTPTSRGLINRRSLAHLKPGAILVNTARGEIADERAILDALRSGRLAAAALDVFAIEPLPPRSALRAYARAHPNLILTPHLGASTREAVQAAAAEMATAVERFSKTILIRRESRTTGPR